MYTEKDFRKDYPANKMLTKVNDKKYLISNLIVAAGVSVKLLVITALSNSIFPSDFLEYDAKSRQMNALDNQYIELREQYKVKHEDIVGLDF